MKQLITIEEVKIDFILGKYLDWQYFGNFPEVQLSLNTLKNRIKHEILYEGNISLIPDVLKHND